MAGKGWLIQDFQKELFIVKQEMALENVFFFFIPDLSLVALVYFDLFIHELIYFDIVYSVADPKRADCL